MAYENETTLRHGEKTPLYGTAVSALGNLTYGVGAFSLYGPDGNVLDDFDGVSMTGHDGDDTTEVNVWYTLDTDALEVPADRGVTYIARLEWTTENDSDLVTREHIAEVLFVLLPPVERTATYDITSNLGKTRFWLKDLHNRPPIWGDDEIGDYLVMSNSTAQESGDIDDGNPLLAAALAFDLAAGDAAKLASIKRIAIFQIDNRNLPIALREHAAFLRGLLLSNQLTGEEGPDDLGVIEFVGGVTLTTELFPQKRPTDTVNSWARW